MAILNFPNTGLYVGLTYTGDNGVTYVYDGVKWAGEALVVQGTTGFTGSRGNLGYTGSRGVGFTGSQGNIGYAGSRGNLGFTGSEGYTGSKGDVGDRGLTGNDGTPGLQGNRGYTGSEGLQGTPGQQGLTGAQGINIVLVGSTTTVTTSTVGLGTAGQGWINTTDGDVYFWNTGTQLWENIGPIVGPQGDLGYTGSKGNQGNIGLTGDPGFTGSQGANGYDGSQGDLGYVGSQGELGYTGSQGDLGYVGSQGEIGYVGSQGELGYTGSQGEVGYVGSTGSRGFQGYTGSQGNTGYVGSLGYTGSAGAGYTGSQGEAGGNANTANFVFTASQMSVTTNDDITVVTNANTWTFGADGLLTLPYGQSIGSGTLDGIKLTTDRGTVLFGNTPECVPTLASHFHIMRDDPTTVDLFFGDDYNYVKLPYDSTLTNVGVQIGTDATNLWSFSKDGVLTLPSGNTRIGNVFGTDGIIGSTGTGVGVGAFGQGGYAALQWIDDPEDATFVAAIVVNSPIASTSGTVQIATGIVAGPTAENVWTFGADGNLTVPDDIQDANGSVIRIATTSTAPTRVNGQLWYNSIDGRTYIKYNGQWVDASPVVVPQPSTYLDEITIDGSTININDNTLTISNTGTLLINGAEVTGSTALGDRLVNGNFEVVLDANGVLVVSDDILLPRTGRIIKDCDNSGGTTSMRWINIPADQTVELIRAWTGDPALDSDDVERARISVEWQNSTTTGVSITAFDDGANYTWDFRGDGTLTLPDSSIIHGSLGSIILRPSGVSTSTQALLIYPTVQDGNHIHLTSGGGDTDLYLGNDDQFVKVDHSGTVVVQTYSTATTSTWTFGTDGVLTLPNDMTIDASVSFGIVTIGGTSTYISIDNGGAPPGFSVTTNGTGGMAQRVWRFGPDGELEFPQGSTISETIGTTGTHATTIIQAGIQKDLLLKTEDYVNSTIRTWTFGIDGVLTLSTASVILGNSSDPNVYIETATTSTTSTWTFAADGGLTLPNGATIVDTTSTLVLTPNSPAQVTSLVLRSTYSTYLTADYPNQQSYNQWNYDNIGGPPPTTSTTTSTEGTAVAITLWDSYGHEYSQGDVEYVITGTGITAADFTPAVLTGTFLAANWVSDGGIGYTNTNMLMIANDAIVEGEETFTVTIVTTGTTGWAATGGNYLRVNIADGTTEGSESGHIHLISENMAQTSIFLGNDDKYVKVAADDQIYIKVPNADTSGTSQLWTFGTDGSLTLPIGVSIDESSGSQFPRIIADDGKAFSLQGQGSTGSAAIAWLDYESTSSQYAAVGVNGTGTDNLAKVVLTAGSSTPTLKVWRFDETGVITFPDSTVQTTAYKSTSGSWTLATGSNTVSITVPLNGNYQMWVNGTIPNGIVEWNATVNVSNPNVPAIGSQYAWYYVAGNALVLTSIPNQIIGTVGVISTSSSYVGNTAHVFTFGITNNSTSTQVINWGYTTL